MTYFWGFMVVTNGACTIINLTRGDLGLAAFSGFAFVLSALSLLERTR